jgi:hypothetical protein
MNEEGAVCLGTDEGAEKRNKGHQRLLKTGGWAGEKERERGGQLGLRPLGERRRGRAAQFIFV